MRHRWRLGGIGLASLVGVLLILLWPQATRSPLSAGHTAMAMDMAAATRLAVRVSHCTATGCHTLALVRHGNGYMAVAAAPAAIDPAVAIANFAFAPQTLTINVGDTVTWTNQDQAAHTTTSDPGSAEAWGSPTLNTGQSFGHTFNKTGTFTYHCDFHTFMTASIIVQGSSPAAPTSTATSAATTAPATVTTAPANTVAPANTATTAPAAPGTGQLVTLQAVLNGANEVNSQGTGNQGSTTGSGTATVLLSPALDQICYTIAVTGVTLPAAASHIHAAAAGINGNVVVPFTAPDANGAASGCVKGVDPALLASIVANPANYYVNVHTSDFPAGAVRGQLQSSTAVMLQATLNGANEVNSQGTGNQGSTTGSGTATVMVNPALDQLCYAISVSGITLPAAAAHIHNAAAGINGNIVVPFTAPDASGAASGCVAGVDPALLTAIVATPASYYVNVHTSDFPAGAVRGQLQAGAAPAQAALQATLNGANEVNSQGTGNQGSTTGSGTATVLLSAAADQICYTIAVAGITLPASASHIHAAPAGTNGNIVVPFTAPDANGAASGCVANVSVALLAAIAANPSGYYVNVHTSDFPAGAVRGQLGVAVPPATPTPTLQPTQTAIPRPPVTPQSTPTPVAATETAGPTATALSAVEVHNKPRTVVGGRSTPCDLQGNLAELSQGCVIISSISGPGATVDYTLTYPDKTTQTFTDTADSRGHSLHIFNVAYVPPSGATHGSAETIVNVEASATLPDSTTVQAGTTRFVAIAQP